MSQKIRTSWNKGLSSWNKGLTKEIDIRVAKNALNISISRYGKFKGIPKPLGFGVKVSNSTRGILKSQTHKDNLSRVKKDLISSGKLIICSMKSDYIPWNKGKTVSEDSRIQTSVSNIRKAIAAQKCSPSNLENRIFSIIMYNDLPFYFIGDSRKEHIGGRYPDFKHHSKPIVVEVADKHEKEFRKKYPWKQYESKTIFHYQIVSRKPMILIMG